MTNRMAEFGEHRHALVRNADTPFRVELPIMGIATRFFTNSAQVLNAVEASFGRWRGTAVCDHEPLRITVIEYGGSEGAGDRAVVQHTSLDSHRLLVQSLGSSAIVEPEHRESLAYVSAALVVDAEHFRIAFLEAITFALIAAFDRHPVHAAALLHADRALLLAAPAGTGKSTIAYLAHTNGITVLSDDLVWVQQKPALRIWGGRVSVRLLDDARRHFPDSLRAKLATEAMPSSKTTMEVSQPDAAPRDVSGGAVVCVLARGPQAALRRIEPTPLVSELTRQLAPGFDRFPERQGAVFEALAADGGWHLTLSDNPWDALPHLRRMLDWR